MHSPVMLPLLLLLLLSCLSSSSSLIPPALHRSLRVQNQLQIPAQQSPSFIDAHFHGDDSPPSLDSTPQFDYRDNGGCSSVQARNLLEYSLSLYRTCKQAQAVRTFGLIVWLIVLFYLLGSTASDYFSCTLEKLSDSLKLSPPVAGVTLLAIGNGAPDVFSSVAAFVTSDTGGIGFNCVLGGALFITTVVAGIVALVTVRSCKAEFESLDPLCFVRDICFLLVSLGALSAIVLDGKVYLWEAFAFLSIYVVYAVAVSAGEVVHCRRRRSSSQLSLLDPLLVKGDSPSDWPILLRFDPRADPCSEEIEEQSWKARKNLLLIYKYAIEWPLALPRRLTIPIVEEDRWSRPFAVASAALAPVFLCVLWIIEDSDSTIPWWAASAVGGGLSILLGLLAFFNTEESSPPRRFLWLWLTGGFVMSVVWFYIIAEELVTAMESLGTIFNVDPAILGLTILAWGNSIGDLVADLALACNGRDGIQIAISGCYAGPLFNTVVGLGLSLVVATWRLSPTPFPVSSDSGLFYIIGFLAAGLAWALVMVPLKNMRLSTGYGVGLLTLYLSFLATGMCYVLGWISK